MHTLSLATARWRKSSYSTNNGACLEIARGARFAAVRDSKNPTGPAIALAPTALDAFLDTVKSGAFDGS